MHSGLDVIAKPWTHIHFTQTGENLRRGDQQQPEYTTFCALGQILTKKKLIPDLRCRKDVLCDRVRKKCRCHLINRVGVKAVAELFVPQGFDWIEFGSRQRRIHSEKDSDHYRQPAT